VCFSATTAAAPKRRFMANIDCASLCNESGGIHPRGAPSVEVDCASTLGFKINSNGSLLRVQDGAVFPRNTAVDFAQRGSIFTMDRASNAGRRSWKHYSI
jgi:hypothetical protein